MPLLEIATQKKTKLTDVIILWWTLLIIITLLYCYNDMPIQRPTIPGTCDSRLADLIKCCWQEDAKVYMHMDQKTLFVTDILCREGLSLTMFG